MPADDPAPERTPGESAPDAGTHARRGPNAGDASTVDDPARRSARADRPASTGPGHVARWALVTVACALGATVLAWPRAVRSAVEPLQVPGLLAIRHPDGGGRVVDLSVVAGRIKATGRVDAVFAWLPDVGALEVEDPRGTLELLLGDRTQDWCSLAVFDGRLRLSAGSGDRVAGALAIDRPDVRRVGLSWADGQARALAGGEPIGDALDAARPQGRSSIGFFQQSSVEAFTVTTGEGEPRRVGAEPSSTGWARTLWAGLGTLLLGAALGLWWAMRGGVADRRLLAPAWGLALVALTVAVHGALTGLAERNRERLTGPLPPCAEHPLERAQDLELVPGRPFDTEGRVDGDFVLRATVVLDAGSQLDVLFRAEPSTRDRGLIAGLSARQGVPCDVVVNLGTELLREAGPGPLSPGEPHALRIACAGPDAEVTVDEHLIGTLHSYDLRAGRTALHALRGRALVRDLVITPSGQPRDTAPDLTRWLMVSGALVLGGALLVVLLAGGSPAPWLALAPLATATVPAAPDGALWPGAVLSALLLLATRAGRHRGGASGVAALGTVPVHGQEQMHGQVQVQGQVPVHGQEQVQVQVQPRGPAPLRARMRVTLLRVTGLGVLGVLLWASTEAPPEYTPSLLSQLDTTGVRGGPLPEGALWARHPLTRKFNTWVREQTLRGEPVAPRKQPGTTRVLALGSSSTFGYGVEAQEAWPARLSALLGPSVEVLNAGTPNGTAERLRFPFVEAWLPLQPDVVIVSLSFNDHIELALDDERDHFAAMLDDGVGWFDQWRARWHRRRALKAWQGYFADVIEGRPLDPDVREAAIEAPSRDFVASLQDIVTAARAAGAAVVFVQEPPRDPIKPDVIGVFHDAMAELGARLDVPVAAPKAALDAALGKAGGELFLDAIHPNATGHAIVARDIARTLRDAGLVGG